MAKEFAAEFYSSIAWKTTREAYKSSVGRLCERCLAAGMIVPGKIVHHKNPLTPENINNQNVTLNFENLELVCKNCHEKIHEIHKKKRRYKIGSNGKVTIAPREE